ncbi:hypothetical protein TNIN_461481 [Trichonephila inaurata madagascariensis]|uniref:Uncharacterized protein n=1 Tax=Trichonephila inaurata madagascariensis TaxID=2747483 RepID=A0A8X6YZ55_9ARAC|nr:hypothetical protein TNIN_461481 [Trichonephila inaurata madagascariensis]
MKDLGDRCSWRMLFNSIITHIHIFPHTWNRPSSSASSLSIRPTARIHHLAICMCLVPLKTFEREPFNSDNELKDVVKDRVSPRPDGF